MRRQTVRRAGAVVLFWGATWAALAAVWLLLVDNPALPELITGAVCAALAATASELVRAQRIARVRIRPGLLRHAWRPLLRAPLDVVVVLREVAFQTVQRRPRRGRVRAVRFDHGGDDPDSGGRRGLAEALGSFAPNTIVIGIDRDIVIGHQLAPTEDAAGAVDPLQLG